MGLFKSKKFKVSLGGLLATWGTVLQGSLTVKEAVMATIALVVAYVTSQGIADAGKEKAKIEAAAEKELLEGFDKETETEKADETEKAEG